MSTLVLCLGNLLLGDEGIGVHLARRLAERPLPAGARVLEAGTDVLGAIDEIAAASRLIVVDAMRGGSAPGSIYRTELADCEASEVIGSLHGFDISRVLMLAGGRPKVESVTVLGVEPELIDWSLDLSPRVAEALPELCRLVETELEAAANPSFISA